MFLILADNQEHDKELSRTSSRQVCKPADVKLKNL